MRERREKNIPVTLVTLHKYDSNSPSQTSPFPALSAFQSPPFSVDTAEKFSHTHTHTHTHCTLTLVDALVIASCNFLGRDS